MSREQIATLSESNRFSFTCPIFNSDTEIRACVTLRNKVWGGQRLDIRKGCQACMKAGKCPVANIVTEFAFGKGDDEYASLTPVKGKLSIAVLDRISRVIVMDSTMQNYGCSTTEIDLISTANVRIEEQMKTAPAKPGYKARILSVDTVASGKQVSRSGSKVKQPKASKEDLVAAAAASGDLSAAINEGASS